jgi:excisionase family DNA binding protein
LKDNRPVFEREETGNHKVTTSNPLQHPAATDITRIVPVAHSKLMYSKIETAQMLSLSIRTVENLMINGQLAFRKVGKRVLVPVQALIQFTKRDHVTKRVQ